MNRLTASVVPLTALPRTSFFTLAGGVCAADCRGTPTDAAAIEAAVPRPASFRNSLRFNRMYSSLHGACPARDILFHPPHMTVLVVEDDATVLAFINRLLTQKGHTVLAAEDPCDARILLAEHGNQADLLLIDIVLHGSKGLDLGPGARAAHLA